MSNGLFDVLAIQGIAFPHTNVSSEATVGFEEKDDRDTAFVHLTEATFPADVYLSLAVGFSSLSMSSAQAKTLPGVTAGEVIRLYGEMFVDSLSGEREASLQVRFFNESGVLQGEVGEVTVTEADEWQAIAQAFEVPTGATRANFYLHAGCDNGETIQAWLAHLKITR